jgi:hypothetical protein
MREKLEFPRGFYAEIEIDQDEYAQDPRGDMDMAEFTICENQREFDRAVEKIGFSKNQITSMYEGGLVTAHGTPYMGLERYRHSGDVYAISSTGNFCDRHWDVSPLVGFITLHPDVDSDVIEEAKKLPYTEARELVMKRLNQDIATFNQWLAGEIYEYKVSLFAPDGEQVGDDAYCSGFYGDEDYCLEEAKACAYGMIIDMLSVEDIRNNLLAMALEQETPEGLPAYVADVYKRIFPEEILTETLRDKAKKLYDYITNNYLKDTSPHELVLRVKRSETEEHPDYPLIDWRDEVQNMYTTLGYWDWVEHQLEANRDDEKI